MQTALVTGGGRGIGRAIARTLGGPDTFVIVAGRTLSNLESAALDLESLGGRALAIAMDVSDERSVSNAMAHLRAVVPQLHVLVNNAGVGGGEQVVNSDVRRWKNTIDTNLVGMYLVTREAIPLMDGGGRIVNISSVLGRFGVAGYSAYCASKHGVIGFTRALALELAARHITVNALCPGWVDTEMAALGMQEGARERGSSLEEFRDRVLSAVPIKRIIQPEEVAALVRFLASPAASAITGQTYNICGGQTMD